MNEINEDKAKAAQVRNINGVLDALYKSAQTHPSKTTPLEPTDEMREAGAKRLVSVKSDTDWPDKFSPLQRAAARNEAERVWRSMWLAVPNA